MINLAATQTLCGGAGTGSAITYTVTGLELVGTTGNYKVLAQGQLPSSPGTLYTAPASTQSFLKEILLSNTTGSAVAATLFINGVAAANQIWSSSIPANGGATFDQTGWRVYDANGATVLAVPVALTGDISGSGAGNIPTVLATVNSNVGPFGDATHSPAITVNAKGLITAAASTLIQLAESQVTNLVSDLAAKQPLDSDLTTIAGLTATTDSVMQAKASAWAARTLAQFAADLQSLLTIAESQVTGLVADLAAKAASARLINTTAPITGGGDLSADRTLALTTSPSGQTPVGVTRNIGTASPLTGGGALSGDLSLAIQASSASQAGSMSALQAAELANIEYDAVADFGLVGDLRQTADGACSTGANTKITSATIAFVASDLGKRITLATAGASGVMYVGTITNVDSGTQVTVSPAISTTASGKYVQVGTDNTTAINNMVSAINALTYSGAKVRFPKSTTNRWGFPVGMSFTKAVYFEGIGGNHQNDVSDNTKTGGTCLAWWGANNGLGTFDGFIKFAAVTGVGNTMMPAPRLEHLWIDCRNGDQNQALFGLQLYSVIGFDIRDIFIEDALACGIVCDIVDGLGSTAATGRGLMENVHFRELENNASPATLTPTTTTNTAALTTSGQSMTLAAANGLMAAGYVWVMTSEGWPVLVNYTGGGGTTTLTGCTVSAQDALYTPTPLSGSNVVQAVPGNGSAIKLSGQTDANTNLFLLSMVSVEHGTTWGAAALDFGNADSLLVLQVVINGGSIAATNAINRVTKPGVRLRGSNANTTLSARNNVFIGGSAGAGGCSTMGLMGGGAQLAGPALGNRWYEYQLGNGEPVPTVESGSHFQWTGNGALTDQPQLQAIATAAQVTIASATFVIGGTSIVVPPQGLQVGQVFKWTFTLTKTAAGTTYTIAVKYGTANTTSDATIASQAMTGTAAAEGPAEFSVTLTIVGPLGGSCACLARLKLTRLSAAATGLYNVAAQNDVVQMTPATFNSALSNPGPAFLHVDISANAANVFTVTPPVLCEIIKASSP